MLALAIRVGLMPLDEARLRAQAMLRNERFFCCAPATAPFEPGRGLKLPPSVMTLFDEFEVVELAAGNLLLARSMVRRSTRHPRLVQLGLIELNTEVASHPFIDTVYEIEETWRSVPRPQPCKSIWHYLLICAASSDSLGRYSRTG